MAASAPQGLPLLSGRPPSPSPPDAGACRKCGKEFNILFNRQKRCMHCGFAYCSTCTDYQALMPRRGPASGHDLAPVCAFCIELLNMTALGRNQLRGLPLAKLMYYVDAYNISVKGAIDKNDIVDAMISVRTSLGCLPTANEAYYRKHRVPKHSSLSGSPSGQSASARARNFFGRAAPHNPPPTSFNPSSNTSGNGPRTYNTTSSRSRPFPRPDLDPSYDEPPETRYRTYTPRPAQSGGARTRATSGPSSPSAGQPAYGQWPRPSPGHSRTSSFSRPHNTAGRPAQPAYTPPSPPPPPPPPPPRAPAASTSPTPAASAPPSLETLLTQSRSAIAALSVGTLKKILWEARVRMPPGVCEKEDLVERVWALLEEERREGVHNNNGSGAEDYSGDGITITAEEDEHLSSSGDHVQHDSSDFNQATFIDDDHPSTPDMARSVRSRPPTPHLSSPSSGKGKERPNHPVETERGGLCVVCQDDEANIAIVDCGHLAMCRGCSDLIMQSSRECPLCRTRIVTEARLLRIFKT